MKALIEWFKFHAAKLCEPRVATSMVLTHEQALRHCILLWTEVLRMLNGPEEYTTIEGIRSQAATVALDYVPYNVCPACHFAAQQRQQLQQSLSKQRGSPTTTLPLCIFCPIDTWRQEAVAVNRSGFCSCTDGARPYYRFWYEALPGERTVYAHEIVLLAQRALAARVAPSRKKFVERAGLKALVNVDRRCR